MNILFFCRLYYPHIGGVEKHVKRISEELIKLGHSITIITESHDSSLPNYEKIDGISLYRIPVSNIPEANKKFVIWKWLYQNSHLIHDTDIVHIHDVFYWWIPFIFKCRKKKYFATFHGWEGVYPPRTSAIWQKKAAAKFSNGSIAVGLYISKWYGINPTKIIYGASDYKLVKSNHSHQILVYGRLSKDNDMDLVLKALREITKKYKKTKIMFFGDGEYHDRAKKLGNVIGFDPEPEKYLSSSSIIISSSYLSIFDSLAMGKNVISVSTNPLKYDYLQMSPLAPFIHIASSVQDIVSIIDTNMENPEINLNGSKWADSYSWSTIAKEYLNLWQS